MCKIQNETFPRRRFTIRYVTFFLSKYKAGAHEQDRPFFTDRRGIYGTYTVPLIAEGDTRNQIYFRYVTVFNLLNTNKSWLK